MWLVFLESGVDEFPIFGVGVVEGLYPFEDFLFVFFLLNFGQGLVCFCYIGFECGVFSCDWGDSSLLGCFSFLVKFGPTFFNYLVRSGGFPL